jgi:hypothetical protein
MIRKSNLKLNLTNVIGVTGTVAKEIAAKQPELPLCATVREMSTSRA